MILLVYIALLFLSSLFGLYDAGYFSRKGHEAFKFDPHNLFFLVRLTIAAAVFLSTFLCRLDGIVVLVSWALAFSFLHNGFYYEARKRIDGSYKGFFDQTKTPTRFSIGPVARSLMFVFSLLILIVYEVFI